MRILLRLTAAIRRLPRALGFVSGHHSDYAKYLQMADPDRIPDKHDHWPENLRRQLEHDGSNLIKRI